MIRAALIALSLAAAPLAGAAQPVDPDWPCQQRKVTRLSIGQMWTGPLPDALPEAARDDEIERLADRIAARRTTLREVEDIAGALDATAAATRADRLAALFIATFERIDRQRTSLVAGVERYARGQRALAARIETVQDEIADLEAEAGAEDYDLLDRIDELRDAAAIEIRIYEERQSSLRYVCESPVLLEQRAFAIARIVDAAMKDG